ncbi:hypothetical protein BJ878DRAFT_490901 [Calycina marina]|uniref:SANT domain-containing protein n=1 Tax=Calycina marina TaxID=1763456 RepID=A0A9P7Z9Z7_9HELO|nr:hypothetical protein BJ878DRAFT_490901 [Calycina marina]
MSLTIKRPTKFAPKAMVRRRPAPPPPKTVTSPAEESPIQSQPSIPTEVLSVPGQARNDYVPQEPPITEAAPQPTPTNTTSTQHDPVAAPAEQDEQITVQKDSDQYKPPDVPPAGAALNLSEPEPILTDTDTPQADDPPHEAVLTKDTPQPTPADTTQNDAAVREPLIAEDTRQPIDTGTTPSQQVSTSALQLQETVVQTDALRNSSKKRKGAPGAGTAQSQKRARANEPAAAVEVSPAHKRKDAPEGHVEVPQKRARVEKLPKKAKAKGKVKAKINPKPAKPEAVADDDSDDDIREVPVQMVVVPGIEGDLRESTEADDARLDEQPDMRKSIGADDARLDEQPDMRKSMGADDARLDEQPGKERLAPGRKRKSKKKNKLVTIIRERVGGNEDDNSEEEIIDRDRNAVRDIIKNPGIGRDFSRGADIRKKRAEERKEKKAKRAALCNHWSTTLTDDEEEAAADAAAEVEAEAAEASELAGVERPDAAVDGEDDNDGSADASEAPVAASLRKKKEPARAITGPQMHIVNGVLVVDQNSTQLNRQAMADAERDEEELEVVEDNFSRLVNHGTHGKQRPVKDWTREDERKFFEGIRRYGSDFDLIATLLGRGRTARQCKLKYNREDKKNPERITRAHKGIPEPPSDDEMPGEDDSLGTATPPDNSRVDLVDKYKRNIEASIGERLENPREIMAGLAAAKRENDEQFAANLKAQTDIAALSGRIILLRGKIRDAKRDFAPFHALEEELRLLEGEAGDVNVAAKEGGGSGREASAAPRPKPAAKKRGKKNPHSSGTNGPETEIILEG